MCGHVGIAGKLEFKDEATMKRLLIYDFFRGPDSTGFAAMRNTKEVIVTKIASNPIDLFDMKKFATALSGHNSTVFLGHNRLATKGVVNNYNAHPYQFDHITCAHNGTLDQSSWKALEDALGEKYEVDSMAIAAAISKLGIEATVPLLQGAWALVWIDSNEGTLNFLRNDQRPFWYAYTEDFTKLFWASEWPMIDAATRMSSATPYKLHSDPEKGYRFWATKEDLWYRFNIEELKKGSEGRPKPHVKELKGKVPPPVVTYTGGYHPFHRTTHQTHVTPIKETSKTTLIGSTDSEVRDNVSILHVRGTKAAPFAGFLTKQEFTDIAKYGCSWCQASVEFDQIGVQVFKKQNMVLCPSCSPDNEVSRIYLNNIAV